MRVFAFEKGSWQVPGLEVFTERPPFCPKPDADADARSPEKFKYPDPSCESCLPTFAFPFLILPS
jgi:hypothetical protein